jgi:hypothetical protein
MGDIVSEAGVRTKTVRCGPLVGLCRKCVNDDEEKSMLWRSARSSVSALGNWLHIVGARRTTGVLVCTRNKAANRAFKAALQDKEQV